MTIENLIGMKLICTETGKEFLGAFQGISTNYARNDKGEVFSDEGVSIREERELLDRTRSYFAYISSDGNYVTGWKGNILMTITQSWSCALSRTSFTHSKNSFKSIRAIDVHGGRWFGRGSAGICVSMRPCKSVEVTA
jgi:hypothetical protein